MRVLIVAYYFPPIGGIGSIRMAGFAAHLPEFGWEPTVIAPRSTPHPGGAELDPSVRVVRSTSIEAARLARLTRRRGRSKRTAGSGEANRGLGARARLASLLYPDPQIGWYPGAVLAGRRLIRREPFDAVFSSAYPITAHLVGRSLSRSAQRPWVAELRDPWSVRLGASHPHRDRAVALERSLAGSASRLVMPTPSLARHYEGLWGREIAVIPNGHDGEIAAGPRPSRPTITYAGMFYPSFQSLTVLWSAIRRLIEIGVLGAPVLRFIGEIPTELRRELADFGLEGNLEETEFVSHREAKTLMASSSILIASGPVTNDPVARGVVPAKLFEYLATSLPILYFGDREGDAPDLLLEHPGCYVVAHDDVEGAAVALESSLTAPPPRRRTEELSRRSRAGQLARVLDDVVGS